jgi:hypothetical protein
MVGKQLAYSMAGGPFSGSATFINTMTNGVPGFSFPDPFLSSAIAPSGTQNVQGTNPHMKLPYTQQWNLTVEKQVGEFGFRASYVGTRSVNLIYERNLNELAPSTVPFSIANRPHSLYGNIIYADSGGNQFYNGLELAVSRKYSKNLMLNAGFTWSRDLTDTQDLGYGGTNFGGQVIQNQFCRACEKAVNGLTVPRRVFANAIYTLPLGKNQRFLGNANRWVDALLGGWNTSWNVTLQDGQFFTPSFAGFDPSNTGSFGGRPDRVAGAPLYPANQTVQHWFNASAFAIPGCPQGTPVCSTPANVGRFGNSGLNILEGPGLADLDLSLMKYFVLREKTRLQLRAIAVNSLNHPNFGLPRSNISSSGNVGVISSQALVLRGLSATRELDLGLRLEF